MLGGGQDYGSKGIFGISKNDSNQVWLLIVDPHYDQSPSVKINHFIYWRATDQLGT